MLKEIEEKKNVYETFKYFDQSETGTDSKNLIKKETEKKREKVNKREG